MTDKRFCITGNTIDYKVLNFNFKSSEDHGSVNFHINSFLFQFISIHCITC